MSNGHDRKSMDDVLASIRRIVRAEKEPEAEPARDPEGPDDEHGHDLAEGDRMPADAPLELTPDMRMGGEDAVEPEAIARPAGSARSAPPSEAASETASEASPDSPAPDSAALRQMVRAVMLAELTSGAAEGAVRGIIRDELMNGQIGNNISQNVLRLIQSEVSKALDER